MNHVLMVKTKLVSWKEHILRIEQYLEELDLLLSGVWGIYTKSDILFCVAIGWCGIILDMSEMDKQADDETQCALSRIVLSL